MKNVQNKDSLMSVSCCSRKSQKKVEKTNEEYAQLYDVMPSWCLRDAFMMSSWCLGNQYFGQTEGQKI